MAWKLPSFFKPAAAAKSDSPQLGEQIQRARSLHQQGQLPAAVALYDEILVAHPDSAEAHYRRANVLKDQGALDAAVSGYDAAIALKPDYAHAFCNRAVVLGQLQRLPEALASYDRAIALDPADAVALYNRGLLLITASGDKDAALASFDEAIACNPDFSPAHFGRATLLQEGKKWAASLASYDRVIALNPGDTAAHYNRGTVLKQLQRWREALESYDRAIALNARLAPAHASRAEVLQELGRFAEALESYDRAIGISPGDSNTHNARGAVLQRMGEFSAALASYNQAIAANPNYPEAYFNRGTVLAKLHEPQQALASYDQAIAARPGYAEAYINRSIALTAIGSIPEALASVRQGIALNPDIAEGPFNLALIALQAGDFLTGWQYYEWRWRARNGVIFREKRDFDAPLWLGEADIAGKTILLYGEQGLGDSLQFCRYAALVAQLGARVILEVPRPLVSLCSTLKGMREVLAFGDPLPDFDVQCPLMSLPLAFKTTLETVPAAIPYVSSDPRKVAAWQERLGAKLKPRIGLTWSGKQSADKNPLRHFPLANLLPYLPDDFQYFCLQTDVTEADALTLAATPAIRRFEGELRDFTDTAALCECMDILISVDTSVAHLGGALGKKTWVLLVPNPDWRWLTAREDSPWYPTVRLFRQKSPKDWNGVFERVAAELRRERVADRSV
jgi:tetratricopeptide (TPR) repeat protein